MSAPSWAEGAHGRTFGVCAATFRFAAPARFALVRSDARPEMRKLVGAAANTDKPQLTKTTTACDATGKRAQRTAGKRLPHFREMEQLHDVYGGVFPDGSDPGSA
jgi:hypothetical protein